MFGLSGEHLILLTLALFVFGPKGLPRIGTSVGRAARGVRDFLGKDSSLNRVDTIEAEFRPVVNKQSESKPNL